VGNDDHRMQPTLALFASSRRNGNTGKLMDRVASQLSIQTVDLSEKKISAFDYEHKNRHDDFEPLMEQVLQAHQIIFASPVYWYAVSPPMKIFLDRISDYLDLPDLLEKGRKLRGKRAYVLCTSVYAEVSPTFMNGFRDTFDYLGMEFGGFVHGNCKNGYNAHDYEKDVQSFIGLLSRPANNE
jgi:multimeric flavodoxin WrbA